MSEVLNYKIQKADKYPNKSGAIFLIHGYGSNSEDLFSFKTYLPKNLAILLRSNWNVRIFSIL